MKTVHMALWGALLISFSDAPVLEGWRGIPFGLSKDAVQERLGGVGYYHAGGFRLETTVNGVPYTAFLKFEANRLREVFMRSGIKAPTAVNDRLCLATHAAVVRSLEDEHPGSHAVDGGGRGGPIRSEFRFAQGAAITVETKALPTLSGGGLCDTTIWLRGGVSAN